MRGLLAILAVMAVGGSAWGMTGTVVDNKGRPVAKAKVGVWTFWTSGRTYHADRNGEFMFARNIASDGKVYGTNHKVVDANGKPIPNAIAIVPWSNDGPIRFVTDKKGQFTFDVPGDWDGLYRVMDSAGAPVPRAKIIREPMSEIVTDDRGEYRIDGWQPRTEGGKEFGVNVLADGYVYSSTTLDAEKARAVTIRLRPEKVFGARIVDEHGAPLPGARVIVDSASGKMKDGGGFDFAGFDLPSVWVTSGKDGAFELRHLPDPGAAKSADIALTIDSPGRARIERRAYKLAELRKEGKIALPRACVLQGTLSGPAGPGALPDDLMLVMYLREEFGPPQPSEHWVAVGKDGKYSFDKLPPGRATIILYTRHRRALGWVMPAVRDLKLAAGEVKNLDLKGTTGAILSGTVRDKATGNPVRMAELIAEHAGNPEGKSFTTDETLTDKEGKYSLRVVAGKVNVYVHFFFLGDKAVTYEGKDRTVISVEVADGESKSGLDFSVGPGK